MAADGHVKSHVNGAFKPFPTYQFCSRTLSKGNIELKELLLDEAENIGPLIPLMFPKVVCCRCVKLRRQKGMG